MITRKDHEQAGCCGQTCSGDESLLQLVMRMYNPLQKSKTTMISNTIPKQVILQLYHLQNTYHIQYNDEHETPLSLLSLNNNMTNCYSYLNDYLKSPPNVRKTGIEFVCLPAYDVWIFDDDTFAVLMSLLPTDEAIVDNWDQDHNSDVMINTIWHRFISKIRSYTL